MADAKPTTAVMSEMMEEAPPCPIRRWTFVRSFRKF
jgi:hypothetical protein